MEQLKHYLRLLRRNQFWALTGLIVLVGLISWFVTVRSLATEQQEHKTSIETSYSAVDNVMRTQNHQNREVQQKMEELIGLRRQQVQQAWQEKFNQQSGGQSKEDILKWPEKLGPEFIQHVQKLRPIEQAIPDPWPVPDDKIQLYMRENYRDYVKQELPKLAEKIGSVWAPDLDGRAGFNQRTEEPEPGRFSESPADRDSAMLVSWNPEDQQRIQSAHFDWSSGYRTPSSLQVLYAQEDLWVLTALMEIISKTNGNATVRHNANIKQIEFIQIGRSTTVGQRGKVRRVIAPGAPSELRSEEASEAPPEEQAIPDREEGSAEGAERRIEVDPADLRYVDKFYNALPAATLRAAASSDRPEDAYLRVAKRMPIRMRVRMDQRAINRLLVECANFNLTVEVRQIRVNPQDLGMRQGVSGMSYLQEGGEPAGGDFLQEFGGRREGFSLEGPPRLGRLGGLEIDFPYDVIVEIYGIIYIYNPVDETILRGDEEGGAGRSLAAADG
jgi:hypothetical protein